MRVSLQVLLSFGFATVLALALGPALVHAQWSAHTQLSGLQLWVSSISLAPAGGDWWWITGTPSPTWVGAHVLSCYDAESLNEPFVFPGTCQYPVSSAAALLQRLRYQDIPSDVAIRAPKTGELWISEVNWPGTYVGQTSYSADEWIELYNSSDLVLSTTGVQIAGAGISGASIPLPDWGIIPPYGYYVVARQEPIDSTLSRVSDYSDAQMRLSNTVAGLQLLSAAGEVLDALPTGLWQAGRNDTVHFQRASAQRAVFDNSVSPTWEHWTTCVAEPDMTQCARTPLHWLDSEATSSARITPWQASLE